MTSSCGIVDEMNIAKIPRELIELICSWTAESAFEESELREAAGQSLSQEDVLYSFPVAYHSPPVDGGQAGSSISIHQIMDSRSLQSFLRVAHRVPE